MVPGGQLVIRNPRWGSEYRLYCLFDLHIHNKGCALDRIKETIKDIKKDGRALWLGGGDYWDFITWGDKRFNPENVRREDQAAHFRGLGNAALEEGKRLFGPIGSKCFGMMQGNHDRDFHLRFTQAVIRDLCGIIHTQYLGYSFFKDLVFTDGERTQKFRIYGHHGAGRAMTKGAKLNRLERFGRWFDSDIVLTGHTHMKTDDEVVFIGANKSCRHIVARDVKCVIAGTYLRTYVEDLTGDAGYGEVAAMEPTPIGSAVVVITPGTRRIAVEKR